MKRFIPGIVGLLIIVLVLIGVINVSHKDYLVVATNFPAYDFARAIVGAENVKMLVPPGTDIHSYEPTPEDLVSVSKAKLFIYNGGESDAWVNNMLEGVEPENTLKMMDLVALIPEDDESTVSINSETEEFDEHVWTSPENAMMIVGAIADKVSEIFPEKREYYDLKVREYTRELDEVNSGFRGIVGSSERNIIIFGDRFPLKYFVREYGLEYLAAFPGCAEETEADAKTIADLIDRVNNESIPVVFKLELSDGSIAETIASETNAEVLEFNSMHNISKQDFDSGLTYVDIMKKNQIVLEKALK